MAGLTATFKPHQQLLMPGQALSSHCSPKHHLRKKIRPSSCLQPLGVGWCQRVGWAIECQCSYIGAETRLCRISKVYVLNRIFTSTIWLLGFFFCPWSSCKCHSVIMVFLKCFKNVFCSLVVPDVTFPWVATLLQDKNSSFILNALYVT